MSDKDAQQQEPSMEDILASIRKILSEDEEEQPAKPEPPPEPAPPPPPPPEPEPDPEPEPEPEPDEDILELTDDMVEEPEPEPDPEPEPEPEPVWEPPPPEPEPVPAMSPAQEEDPEPDDDVPLIEPAVAEMSSRYLNELTHSMARQDIAIGDGGVTLETLVRQITRELVKEWLDANLPGITERLVQREIERLSKGAGKR